MTRQLHSIEADGVRLRVAIRGEGRPLLLVMGLGGHLDMWGPLEQRLLPYGIRTVSYDAPGTGESTGYGLPRRVRGHARTAERLLDALGLDRVDVLGVSFGGGVAQQLAHQSPDRVRRLVLAATSSGALSVPGRPDALLALATPRRYVDPEHYGRIAPRVFGGLSRRDPAAGAGARFAHPPSLKGYAYQLYAGAGWTSLFWLQRLRQPTLVLAGDDDPIVPVQNGRLLARLIPEARLHVVRGGGHLFLLEQADEVAPVIAGFLSQES